MRLLNFNRVVGNMSTKNIIIKSLSHANGFPQVSSFVGLSGTGKSTCAEISALRLICENPDGPNPCLKCNSCKEGLKAVVGNTQSRRIKKINSASVDKEVMESLIREIFHQESTESTVRIFEEVHCLDNTLQTKLLEELDRIPENMYVMFCTTKPLSMLPELRNRCQTFKFNRLTSTQANLLIDSECSRLKVNLPRNIRRLILTHTRGIPREITRDMEFVQNNYGYIGPDDFESYFCDVSFDKIRLLLKSYDNTEQTIMLLDELLENCTPYEFISRLKDYLMDMAFLAKDISFRETQLTAEDKSFAKTLGYGTILNCFNMVDSSYKPGMELVDIQFLVLKIDSKVQKSLKKNATSLGLTPSDIPEEDKAITKDIKARAERKDKLEKSGTFVPSLSDKGFDDFINENVHQDFS